MSELQKRPAVSASSVSDEEIAKIKRELCGILADDMERVIGVCGITVEQVSALLDEVLRSRLAASPAIPAEVREKYVVIETTQDHDVIGWGWFRIETETYAVDVDLPFDLGRILVAASAAPTKETTDGE